ncbi:MAG: carbohydrate kinase family protein [Saccharofermentanales bacterium]
MIRILAFGEILWDVYPDRTIIGGAPFNFASHISRLGADASIVTAVGQDDLGQRAEKWLSSYHVNDVFLIRSELPTGQCKIQFNDQNQPSYTLIGKVAYDDISLSEEQLQILSANEYDAFYFGTLAQRSMTSRNTVRTILNRCSFRQIFFDINIRQNYYNAGLISEGLEACTILKISRDEIFVFRQTGLSDINPAEYGDEDGYYSALCRKLSEQYRIMLILLTMDKEGAMIYDAKTNTIIRSSRPKGKVVSTVGAGDSFSACFLYFYLKGCAIADCLEKAVMLSDYVVQHNEAIPAYTPELAVLLQNE